MNLRKPLTLLAVACIMGGTLYAKTQAPDTKVAATQEVKAGLPTLLDLSAEWCSACQYQHKILEEMKTRYSDFNVQYVDVTKDEEMAKKYHITVIPTLVLLSPEGEALDRHEGAMEEADLVQWFAKAGYEIKPN